MKNRTRTSRIHQKFAHNLLLLHLPPETHNSADKNLQDLLSLLCRDVGGARNHTGEYTHRESIYIQNFIAKSIEGGEIY